jgi:hypothetical protein
MDGEIDGAITKLKTVRKFTCEPIRYVITCVK